ncbi:hypothetical protein GCM10010289_59000 [Streptomyces violascens]|nr:hypothetical protein GCM10010289_59000 [Streptomyces violascens]
MRSHEVSGGVVAAADQPDRIAQCAAGPARRSLPLGTTAHGAPALVRYADGFGSTGPAACALAQVTGRAVRLHGPCQAEMLAAISAVPRLTWH